MRLLSTTLSPTQLINLWMQLEDAYHGVNSFGGDTAEIYAYTLVASSPIAGTKSSLGQQAARDQAVAAAEALDEVLTHFEAVRQCRIEVDGDEDYGKVEPFDHRVHVRIIR